MSDERIGEGLTWEDSVTGEGLEGFPRLIGVAGEEGLMEVGL